MQLDKTIELEVMQVYDTWLNSYLEGDVDTYNSFLDDEFRFIGSTDNEEFLSKEETTNFLKSTADQLSGKTEVRNSQKTVQQVDEITFVTHLFDGYFLNGDAWSYYGRFRFTSALQKKKKGWQFIYQHCSTPDAKAEEGETLGVEQITKENRELRNAIKRRTTELENKNRELEIEAALDRVRSASMAMQESDELASVARTVFEQLRVLGINVYRSWIDIFHVDQGYVLTWSTDFEGNFQSNPATFPLDFDETMSDFYRDYKSLSKFIELEAHGDDVREWFDYLYSVSSDPIFKMPNVPDDLYQIWAKHKYGTVATTKLSPIANDEKEILNRFASVFEQAYTRFLDLQKAEDQAREAQIETALERVRSRTMAMQHSDELIETSELMFEQIKNLDIELWSCGFSLWYDDDNYFIGYNPGPEGKMGKPLRIPLTEDVFFTTIREAKRRGEEFLVFESEGKSLEQTYRYMDGLPVVGETMRGFVDAGYPLPTYQVTHCGFFSEGHLMFITQEHNPEAIDVFKRFTKVFDQTYTRFLDLQKAEAQTREAQIEAALEKVRSRTMAMHKSEELKDVVKEIFDQLARLNINAEHAGIVVDYEPEKDWHFWIAETQDIPAKVTVPYLDLVWDRQFTKAKKAGQTFFTTQLNFKEKNSFYKTLLPHIEGLNKEASDFYFSCPGLAISTTIEEDIGLYIENFSGTPYSEEENKILKRFGKVFQQAYTRFLDLQKAEAQAREAEIQLALERVRARTMAMQKSDELSDVIALISEQMDTLQIPVDDGVALITFNEDSKDLNEWMANEGFETATNFHLPYFDHPVLSNLWEAKEQGQKELIQRYSAKESRSFLNHIFQHTDFSHTPEPVKEYCLAAETYATSIAFQKNTAIFINDYSGVSLSDSEMAILHRFAKEFDQTYTRFRDLQKAEEQARESRVNLAVERVRARALAMFKSEEILEVVYKLKEEIMGLDIPNVTAATIHLKEPDGRYRAWDLTSIDEGENELEISLDIRWHMEDTHPDFFMREVWDRTEDYFIVIQGGDRYKHTIEWLHQNGYSKHAVEFEEFLKSSQLEKAYHPTVPLNNGRMCIDLLDPPAPEIESILKKMAGAFDLAYKRFEDLQKAEAQAREAKIETALEKIRSRTMGMQSSDELPEVANMLFLEVQELGIPAWSCGYCILEEDRRSSICIMSSEGTLQKPFLLPHTGEASFLEWDDFVHNDQTFFTQELGGEAIDRHYNYMKSLPQLTPVFNDLKEAGLSLPTYQINHLCKFSHGFLLFITYEEVHGSHDIFKRFTKVFDQTYTRFLDLKKAEAQTKEAQIELSLERIRAQVTSMQESSELFDIVVKMRTEFVALGHQADHFWHMRWLPDVYEMSMTSEDGSRIGMVINVPKFVHDDIPKLAEWEKGDEPIFVLALDADDAWDYIENMNTHGHYEQADPDAPSREDIEHIGGLTFIIARTTHGEIGYSLPGVVPKPPEDALDTLVRFAGVFDLAYKRFEDLKAAEQQALLIREERDRLEIALEELNATQDQLVQQEKLASLGQLTAGIAHEIKNPLNFVNNFSDVSVELVEEAKEEVRIQESGVRSDKSEILKLLDDIKMNLLKIHEHGSRADSIVKSMLEHSRGGSGKMEPADLNALVKEFANLSFHGMRASKDPINVEIEFNLDESIGKVPLIAEDFSRVILNLCNNGFDAMREKLTGDGRPTTEEKLLISEFRIQNSGEYRPKLMVRTMQSITNVTVEIEDNGPGIPEEFKDKILQPFFTTKKGTQGTGLGLSITNDIVKAHGGSMDIQSQPGQTVFTIKLNG